MRSWCRSGSSRSCPRHGSLPRHIRSSKRSIMARGAAAPPMQTRFRCVSFNCCRPDIAAGSARRSAPPAVRVTRSCLQQFIERGAVQPRPRHAPGWRPTMAAMKGIAQPLAWNIGTTGSIRSSGPICRPGFGPPAARSACCCDGNRARPWDRRWCRRCSKARRRNFRPAPASRNRLCRRSSFHRPAAFSSA